MLSSIITFNSNKKESSPEEIERQFELTRTEYLKEMSKLRKKYEIKFLKLASEYSTACL